jgi:hypothetical protein
MSPELYSGRASREKDIEDIRALNVPQDQVTKVIEKLKNPNQTNYILLLTRYIFYSQIRVYLWLEVN